MALSSSLNRGARSHPARRESPDVPGGPGKTFAIVVNWNGGENNASCLRSLSDQGLDPASIVFVDNASTDGSLESVTRDFPGLLVVRNDENVGYGHAVNQGARLALERGAAELFLVNNDIELPAGCLAGLKRALDEGEGLGIVGPRVVYKDRPDRIWAAGGELSYRQNLTTLIGHKRADSAAMQRTFAVDFVPGCALLAKREVVDDIGLLEGDYFAYHEDVDFCIRAAQAGHGVACVGQELAFHRPHSSTGGGYNPRRKYMMAVNAIWFLRRHGTPAAWIRYIVFDVLTLPPLFIVGIFTGRSRAVLAKLRGTLDGVRGRRVTAHAVE